MAKKVAAKKQAPAAPKKMVMKYTGQRYRNGIQLTGKKMLIRPAEWTQPKIKSMIAKHNELRTYFTEVEES